MIQRTFFVKGKDDYIKCIDQVKAMAEYKNAMSVLAVLHVNGIPLKLAKVIVDYVRDEMPETIIAGISVINSTEDWNEHGVTISFIMFESTQVMQYTYRAEDYTDDEVIEDFKNILNTTDYARVVLAYPAETKNDFPRVLDEISSNLNKGVTFFGTLAATYVFIEDDGVLYSPEALDKIRNLSPTDNVLERIFESDDEKTGPSVFTIGDDLITNGCVFTVLVGEHIHERAKYVLGWNPLGKSLGITKGISKDVNGNACLKEIDGMPAAQIYRKYLDVEVDEYFLDNVCEFPIIINREGTNIARVPLFADKNEYLFFSGDIRDDDDIKLSYAIPEDLLRVTEKAAREVEEYNSQALMLSICFNRFHFLKKREREEIDLFRKINENVIFGFGGYEILKDKNHGGILNSALAILALKEGDDNKDNTDIIVSVKEENKVIKPLNERLLTFIDTCTKELEIAYKNADKAYKEAEKANAAKSIFLSNMSHEIRTPINAIIGMDEMILREAAEPVTLSYARDIKAASLNLLGIVNDILDFSKIEAGKMELVLVEYELASVLNDLINMIKKRAEDKGLELVVNVDPEIPHILYGDEIRLKQIITNILTNGVKYTDEGRVCLTVRRIPCTEDNIKEYNESVQDMLLVKDKKLSDKYVMLEVTVEDTGIGIKEEDMPKIFQSFERIEEERNRTIEGSGLGMNITEKLLRMMGSTLNVKSEYGVGTMLTFKIVQRVVDERPIGNFEDALRRSLTAVENYHESFTAENAHILVVDDTEMNLTVFTNLLKRTRLQIDTALSGMECLEKIKKRKYDIIFLDHRMPEMDGIECLQHIKADSEGINSTTPVIALTANAISGSRDMYIEAGFDDYLTKPIASGVLEAMIMDYLPAELVKKTLNTVDDSYEGIDLGWIDNTVSINPQLGVSNCGDAESFIYALKTYAEAMDDMSQQIKTFYEAGNWVDYTTKVHALKSSSRIIGAMEIGKLAEELENAGNNGDVEKIKALNDELLTYHKALGYQLRRHILKNEEDENKPLISEEKLQEAYIAIKEIAQTFDYDTLKSILNSLEDYKIPDEKKEKYLTIKKAINDADWDAINALMEGEKL